MQYKLNPDRQRQVRARHHHETGGHEVRPEHVVPCSLPKPRTPYEAKVLGPSFLVVGLTLSRRRCCCFCSACWLLYALFGSVSSSVCRLSEANFFRVAWDQLARNGTLHILTRVYDINLSRGTHRAYDISQASCLGLVPGGTSAVVQEVSHEVRFPYNFKSSLKQA